MAKNDGTFLLVGAYASVNDAKADYEVVRALHAEKVIGGLSTRPSSPRTLRARCTSTRTRTATRQGGWGGAGVGSA